MRTPFLPSFSFLIFHAATPLITEGECARESKGREKGEKGPAFTVFAFFFFFFFFFWLEEGLFERASKIAQPGYFWSIQLLFVLRGTVAPLFRQFSRERIVAHWPACLHQRPTQQEKQKSRKAEKQKGAKEKNQNKTTNQNKTNHLPLISSDLDALSFHRHPLLAFCLLHTSHKVFTS